jgi:glycosylphosphatidylinositol transamidase (GPIT) subunit GPI8
LSLLEFLLGSYGELLVMLDTCHASSMTDFIVSPNVLAIAASTRDEESKSV